MTLPCFISRSVGDSTRRRLKDKSHRSSTCLQMLCFDSGHKKFRATDWSMTKLSVFLPVQSKQFTWSAPLPTSSFIRRSVSSLINFIIRAHHQRTEVLVRDA